MLDHAKNLSVFGGNMTEIHGNQNNYNYGSTTYNTDSYNRGSYNTKDSHNDSSRRGYRNRGAHQSSSRTINILGSVPYTDTPSAHQDEAYMRQKNEDAIKMAEEARRTLEGVLQRGDLPSTFQPPDLEGVLRNLQQQDFSRRVHTDSSMDLDESEEEVQVGSQTYHNNSFPWQVPPVQPRFRGYTDPPPSHAMPSTGSISRDPLRQIQSDPAVPQANADSPYNGPTDMP